MVTRQEFLAAFPTEARFDAALTRAENLVDRSNRAPIANGERALRESNVPIADDYETLEMGLWRTASRAPAGGDG